MKKTLLIAAVLGMTATTDGRTEMQANTTPPSKHRSA